MKKDSKGFEASRPYRLSHQTLCITGFNFETESLVGYVEMLIHPLKPDLRRIKINSKQCRIYRVAVNDLWEANFSYNDPTLEICQGDAKQRNLDYYENGHYSCMAAVDPDWGNGELTIKIPQEAQTLIADMKAFKLCVEFSLEHPKGGIKFVVPDVDDIDGTMLDRGAHLFTYGHANSTRLWFPCIDSYSEVCTWKLEFTVDMYMTAVSCGDLIETVYTADLRKKTYHYYLSAPTSAPNIALAVGPFEVVVDPNMHEVTHFCLPHLVPILKQATAYLHEAFEFYEELLSCRYPFSCYKQVFVDQVSEEANPYATMTIFNTNLLHSKKIIDQTPISRQYMAQAIADQFFGCYIPAQSWSDIWLTKGIAGYLANLYRRKAFGNNDYRTHIAAEMEIVKEYESNVGLVVLDPSSSKDSSLYFQTKNPHTVSPRYTEVFLKKAHLVLRMLEIRIGRELLIQVLNKLLCLAMNVSQQKFTSHTWSNMLLSTSSFLRCISSVTGKDVGSFIEQWVQQGGFARFFGSFVFNRKRNVVELDLKQDLNARGAVTYVGPLTVTIQELDGTFNHSFKIEENRTKFEITCHSKSRRHKKKKIPLSNGEEVDMDLNDTDADSPVLWLRVDPDMTIMRSVKLDQPDFMWQYMLRYERDVVSQCEAIDALEQYPTPKSRLALTDTIENDKSFYQVRIQAAFCLAKVANAMVNSWAGPPAMMTIFRKMFGSHSCPTIVKQNNFNNFQHYFLQKAIPRAMATLRNVHGICPQEVMHFLLDLFKYNDNSKNKFADNYYKADLINALAATITPAVTPVTITGTLPSTDALTSDTKLILEEITRFLNMEKLLPSYRLTVTVSCLKAIRRLQKFGHLPSDVSVYKSYAVPGNFVDVRLASLETMVDYTRVETCGTTLNWLLDLVEEDPEPFVKYKVLMFLVENPPFTKKDENPLSTVSLVERLWTMMNTGFSHDSRLRCAVADFYHTLYGRTRPACLPIPDNVMVLNLKEKRTLLSASVMESEDEDSRHSAPKRLALSPEHINTVEVGSMPLAISNPKLNITAEHVDHEESQFKLKIRFGSRSPEVAKTEAFAPLKPPSPMMASPARTPAVSSPAPLVTPSFVSSSFVDEFMKFSDIAAPVDETSMSQKPPMTILTETVSVTSKLEESTIRLSEDSNSNSLPDFDKTRAGSVDTGPTAFSSSMFSTPTATGATNSPALSQGTEESTGHKHHKNKKKKKKSKHKHKHKHKRDKDDKGDRPRDTDGPSLGSIIVDHMTSSGPSNTNSPAVGFTPSSPEFEVM